MQKNCPNPNRPAVTLNEPGYSNIFPNFIINQIETVTEIKYRLERSEKAFYYAL
jgi:hypothetical protein